MRITYAWMTALTFLLAFSQIAGGAGSRIRGEGKGSRFSVELRTEVPSYGPPQRGTLYGGPYPPYPYGLYPPYPFSDRLYAPPSNTFYGDQLIPAGRLVLLVDPVDAVVSVDGLQLKLRSNLSYAVGLLIGEHQVAVNAQGYQPYVKSVEIPEGEEVLITIKLKSLK